MFIPVWSIPLVVTLFCLCMMFRPLGCGLDVLFRPLWLIPTLFAWVLYLALVVAIGK